MTTTASKNLDLASLFGTVAKTLNQNKSTLNEADTYNHDHGDNMAQIFEVITQAMKEKSSADPADQLAYASELLRKQSSSGSAKIYSEGLSDAAKQFSGKSSLTTDNIAQLVSLLMGVSSGAASSTANTAQGGDLLGTLLGSLSGTAANDASTGSQSGGEDVLGSLLNSLTGTADSTAGANQNAQDGIDLGDVLNAGMAFMQAKQSGGSNLQAIMSALSSSKVGTQDYRKQSGALVANTLLNAVAKMTQSNK
jgi:hypothetical protein